MNFFLIFANHYIYLGYFIDRGLWWLQDVQFSSVQLLSRVWLFATPWITERQASLSITNSRSSLRLTSIKSMMPSSHLILCRPLLLLPPISSSIRVFSNVYLSVSSVTQSCPTLCNPIDCSMPGLPVHHQLPEFTQTGMQKKGSQEIPGVTGKFGHVVKS